MPNDKNCSKLEAKLVNVTILEKNKAINPGLQGITINPKNNPKKKASKLGFLNFGLLNFGKNLEKSISNINIKLIIANMLNAVGDTIPITFVSETLSMVVNINPMINIKLITPEATNKLKINGLVFFPRLLK